MERDLVNWRSIINRRSLLGIALGIPLILLAYFNYRVHERIRELQWALELHRHDHDSDLISLEVGTIQFLRRGYSISLEEVSYGSNGVTIAGTIGNPHSIEVSSLTLNFNVVKPFYTLQDQYLDDPFAALFSKGYNIGSSQVAVGTVAPGSTASFRTLIPNVRQFKDDYEVEVSFSGERYQYLR